MICACGCYCKSYRTKQCPYCEQHFCPACFSEHMSCLKLHCSSSEVKRNHVLRNQRKRQ